jgi:hypothetical protein
MPQWTAFQFIVPGHPQGYYACAGRSIWKMSPAQRKRAMEYHGYCEKVRLYALQSQLQIPPTATKDNPVFVSTKAYFQNGVHCDPGNVNKGVIDALFYSKIRKGTSDKYVGSIYYPPYYSSALPRVIVDVIFGDWEDWLWPSTP